MSSAPSKARAAASVRQLSQRTGLAARVFLTGMVRLFVSDGNSAPPIRRLFVKECLPGIWRCGRLPEHTLELYPSSSRRGC